MIRRLCALLLAALVTAQAFGGLITISRVGGTAVEEPGGGGDTQLAIVVNGLSSGGWGEWTLGGTYDAANCPGSGGSWPFSPEMHFSETLGKIFHTGGEHGDPGACKPYLVGVFDEGDNDWDAPEIVPTADHDPALVHGYDNSAIAPNGDLYFTLYGGCDVWKRAASNGAWTQLSDPPSCYSFSRGVAIHPNMDGGSGGLVWVDGLNIQWMELDDGDWHVLDTSGSLHSGDNGHSAAYVQKDDAVYAGGGAGTPNTIYKITADATLSTISSCCSGASRKPYIDSLVFGVDGANVLVATTTSNLILISVGRNEYYEFDGSSWSSNCGSLDASWLASMNSTPVFARTVVPAHGSQLYDAIVFMSLAGLSGNPQTEAWVWRYGGC